jgi:predicted secreted Zn-dependent protease
MKPSARHAEDRRQILEDLNATLRALNVQYDCIAEIRGELGEIHSKILELMDRQIRAINLLQASNNDTF